MNETKALTSEPQRSNSSKIFNTEALRRSMEVMKKIDQPKANFVNTLKQREDTVSELGNEPFNVDSPRFVRDVTNNKDAQNDSDKVMKTAEVYAALIEKNDYVGVNKNINEITDLKQAETVINEVAHIVYDGNLSKISKLRYFAVVQGNIERKLIVFEAIFKELSQNNHLYSAQVEQLLNDLKDQVLRKGNLKLINPLMQPRAVRLEGQLESLKENIRTQKNKKSEVVKICIKFSKEGRLLSLNAKLNEIVDPYLAENILMDIIQGLLGQDGENFEAVLNFLNQINNATDFKKKSFSLIKQMEGWVVDNLTKICRDLIKQWNFSKVEKNLRNVSLAMKRIIVGNLTKEIFNDNGFDKVINWGDTFKYDLHSRFLVYQALYNLVGNDHCPLSSTTVTLLKLLKEKVQQKLLRTPNLYEKGYPNFQQDVTALIHDVSNVIVKQASECSVALVNDNKTRASANELMIVNDDLNTDIFNTIVSKIYKGDSKEFLKIIQFGDEFSIGYQKYLVYENLFKLMKKISQVNSLELILLSNRVKAVMLHRLEDANNEKIRALLVALENEIETFVVEHEAKRGLSLITKEDYEGLCKQLMDISDEEFIRPIIQRMADELYSEDLEKLKLITPLGSDNGLDLKKRYIVYETLLNTMEANDNLLNVEFFIIASKFQIDIIENESAAEALRKNGLGVLERMESLVKDKAVVECYVQMNSANTAQFNVLCDKIVNTGLLKTIFEEVMQRSYSEKQGQIDIIIDFIESIEDNDRALMLYEALFQTLQVYHGFLNSKMFRLMKNVQNIANDPNSLLATSQRAESLAAQLKKIIEETIIAESVKLFNASDIQGIETILKPIEDESLAESILEGIVSNAFNGNSGYNGILSIGQGLISPGRKFIVYRKLFQLVEHADHQESKPLFELLDRITNDVRKSGKSTSDLVSEATELAEKLTILAKNVAIEEFSSLVNESKNNIVDQKLKDLTNSTIVTSILQGIVLRLYKGKYADFTLLINFTDDISSKEQRVSMYGALIRAMQAYPALQNSVDFYKKVKHIQKELQNSTVSIETKKQLQDIVHRSKISLTQTTVKDCVNAVNKNHFYKVNDAIKSVDDSEVNEDILREVVRDIYNNDISNFGKIVDIATAIEGVESRFWVYHELFQIMKDRDHLHGSEIRQFGEKLQTHIVEQTDNKNELGKKARVLSRDSSIFIDRNIILPELDQLQKHVDNLLTKTTSKLSIDSASRAKFNQIKNELEAEFKKLWELLDSIKRKILNKNLTHFNVLTDQTEQLQIKLDEAKDVMMKRRKIIEGQITKNERLFAIVKQVKVSQTELLLLQELIELEGADVNGLDDKDWKPLHHAAETGHKTIVLYLLARGAQINDATDEGDTALHKAAQNDQEVVARVLLEKNADAMIRNKNGKTPRMVAESTNIQQTLLNAELFEEVKRGDIRQVQYYLNINADVNARDSRDWTPLHYAAYFGHYSIVDYIINAGGAINAKSGKDEWSVVHCAAYNGDINIVKALAVKGLTDFNRALSAATEKPLQGATVLHIASWRGHTDLVSYMLREFTREKGYESDLNVDEKSTEQAWTPLHYATAAGHQDTVEMLLLNGAAIGEATKKEDTAIHIASRFGHTSLVKYLAEHGLSIDAIGENDFSSLHYAAQSGEVELVKWIVQQNSQLLHRRTSFGAKAIHMAAQQGHVNVVDYLLSQGCDVHDVDEENLTLLHYAALGNGKEQVDMVLYLIEKGAEINTPTKLTSSEFSGQRPLHIAAEYGYFKTVEALINNGESTEARDIRPQQWTAMHYASQGKIRDQPEQITGVPLKPLKCGHGKVLELLISKGSQRDPLSSDEKGDQPIHIAAEVGHYGLVKLLLSKGSAVDSLNKESWTPLHYASMSGHLDVVQLLVRNHASKTALTTDGREPLHYAMKGSHKAVIEFFLDELGVNELDTGKRTTLHYAVEMGDSKWVNHLLNKGANVAAEDDNGAQPLHLAAKLGYFHIVKLLIEKGADVKAITKRSETALHLAAGLRNYENNRLQIVKYLIEHGSDVNAVDKNDEKPIHLAALNGVTKVMEYLAKIQWSSTDSAFPIGWNKWTLLHYAAKGGHMDNVRYLVEFLIDKGVKINEALTEDDETPLDIAELEDKLDVKEYLEVMENKQVRDENSRNRNRRSINDGNPSSNYDDDLTEAEEINQEGHKLVRNKRSGSGQGAPPTRRPELIDLFINNPVGGKAGIDKYTPIQSTLSSAAITTNKDNYFDPNTPKGFAEHFSLFLEKTPNILGGGKPEFISHLFYGSVMTLPHTDLMHELGIKKILFKSVSDKTMKMLFVVENNGSKRLVFHTVTTARDIDSQKWSEKELTDISKQLNIPAGSDYESEGKIFQINDRKLFVKDFEVTGSGNTDVSNYVRSQLDEISAKMETLDVQDFVEVKKIPEFNDPLETKVSHFSDENIQSVKESSSKFSEDLVKIYNADVQKHLVKLSIKEAGIHNFFYGALAFNFKYQFNLDVNIERMQGKGYVDMTLLSRGKDGKNWYAIPIIAEFKADDTSTSGALDQVKGTGYLYNIALRTVAPEAVALGINSDPSLKIHESIASEVRAVPEPKGFVKQLLTDTSLLNKNAIISELEHLYFSFSNLAIKNKEDRYLNGMVMGEILSTDNSVKKFVLSHEVPDLKKKISTFLIKGDETKPWVLLNLIERGTDIGKVPLPTNVLDGNVNDKIIQVDIEIDSKARDGFSEDNQKRTTGKTETKKFFFHDINIKEVNRGVEPSYHGNYIPIGSFDTNKFFAGNIENGALPDLSEKLKPLNPFINSESDFQAVTQGLFWKKNTDSTIIKTFCELNPSKAGRVDLIVIKLDKSPTGQSVKEDKLILMELKYDPQQSMVAGKKPITIDTPENNAYIIDADTQYSKYIEHLKSITDLPKATVVLAAFAKGQNGILYKVHDNVLIPHTSPALRPQPSPLEHIPPLVLSPPEVDGDDYREKRPLQPETSDHMGDDEDTKKRKIDVVCRSAGSRRKRATPFNSCIFKMDDADDMLTKDNIDKIKLNDLDSEKIREVNGEVLFQFMKYASDIERSELVDITSKAKTNGAKVVANDDLVKAINQLVTENKFQADASKAERVMDKIHSGALIDDLMLPSKGDMKGVAIGPKLLAEAINNYNSKNSGDSFSKTGGKISPYDKSYKMLNKINLGIMGKDLVGKILSGDEKSLAIMAGLVVGDKIAEKISEKVAVKGIKLATAGKLLKGNLLKTAGPIIGSATSGFQIYSLVSNVNQFKNLKETCSKVEKGTYDDKKCTIDKSVTVAGIVGDSISLSITAVTVGLQVFRLISMGLKAAATSTGPLGVVLIVIDVLANIAVQIYVAVKQVESIELLIKLTGGERFREGLRGFFGMSISEYLENLMKIKQGNNQLVVNAVEFLINNANIERYVIPSYYLADYNCRQVEKNGFETDKAACIAGSIFTFGIAAIGCALQKTTVTECDKRLENHSSSWVYLDSEKSFTLDRAVPDSAGRGDSIFCKASSSDGIDSEYTYRCDNAIGVRYPYNRESPRFTLIDLKTGYDVAVGTSYNPNIFLVNQGDKNYKGGMKDDLFIIQAGSVRGTLNGNKGNNTIVVDNGFSNNNPVKINLLNGRINGDDANLNIDNFQIVMGRLNKPETIIPGCDTISVNGQNGYSSSNPDFIHIKHEGSDCMYGLNVKVNQYTVVNNDALFGKFTYSIPSTGDFQVAIALNGRASHFHLLEYLGTDITDIKFDKQTRELVISNKYGGKFAQKLQKLQKDEELYSEPKFSTQDQVFIQITRNEDIRGFIPVAEGSTKSVNGLVNHPNLFYIEGGSGSLRGGSKDDTFLLQKRGVSGSLNGQGGNNVLLLGSDFMLGESVEVDLYNRAMSMGYNRASIDGFQTVFGRENISDEFVAACGTTLINSQGGSSSKWDAISIPNIPCPYDLTLPIQTYTDVDNQALNGNFRYELNCKGNVDINVSPLGEANHLVIFDEKARAFMEIKFDKNSRIASFSNNHGKIIDQRLRPLRENAIYYDQPQFITRDPIEIKIDQEGTVQSVAKLNDNIPNIAGLLYHPNNFLIEGGTQYMSAIGGKKDDLFILQNVIKGGGLLNGVEGINTLMLDDNFETGQKVIINLSPNGFVQTSGSANIELREIHALVARPRQSENVRVSCKTLSVETKGGTHIEFDEIVIPHNPDCDYNIKIESEAYTRIQNLASKGMFSYSVPKEGFFDAKVSFSDETLHYFLLENNLNEITELHFNKEAPSLSFKNNEGGFVSIPLKELNEFEDFYTQPRFTTKDQFEIKVSREGNLVASVNTNLSPEEVLAQYSDLATQLGTTLLFTANSGKDLIHIGVNNTLDILTNSPYAKSHLIGNGGENIYVVATNDQEIISEKQPLISIPEVVIYNFNGGKTADVLDLSPIVRSIRASNNALYNPKIQQEGNDLCILLKSGKKLITTVRLKDILLNNNEEKLEIVLSQVRMQLTQSEHPKKRSVDWTFKPKPLELNRDTELVLLTPEDVESDMNIAELKTSSGHYDFAHSNDDLIITNLFSDGIAKRERVTIILKDYTKAPVLQTLKMEFPDISLVLSEQSNKFVFKNYTDMKEKHREVVFTEVVTKVACKERESSSNVEFNSPAEVARSEISVSRPKYTAGSKRTSSLDFSPAASNTKTSSGRKSGELFYDFSAGNSAKSKTAKAFSIYSHHKVSSLTAEESIPLVQTQQTQSWSVILYIAYSLPGLLVASVGGLLAKRYLRPNAEPDNIIKDAVVAAIPLLTLPSSTEARTAETLHDSTNEKIDKLFYEPLDTKPNGDKEIPLLQSDQTEFPNFTSLGTIESFISCKWLLGIFGKRNVVKRINKSEGFGSINADNRSELDWVAGQLKNGIDKYGTTEEKIELLSFEGRKGFQVKCFDEISCSRNDTTGVLQYDPNNRNDLLGDAFCITGLKNTHRL